MTSLSAPIPPTERLSEALDRLLAVAAGEAMAIRQMVEVLHGRGIQMVIILLCLPFLAPVTIPGISIPFGLAIALCGARLAFGRQPWLPAFILNRRVSFAMLERMVHFGCRIYRRVEKIIRPRYAYVFEGPGMTMLIGLAICLAGILLSLPIPPPFPFTNTIPGFAIILLALGIMERDGALIILGYVLTTVAVVYIGLIAFAGKAGITHLWRLVTGD